MSTRVLFVRHGECQGNLTKRFYDMPEADLTQIGMLQAILAGGKLRREVKKVDVVYCSPWRRAKDTCTIALRESGIEYRAIVYDERIRERGFTGLAGKLVNWDGQYDGYNDAISGEDYEAIWTYDSPVSERFKIETLTELKWRVGEFLEDIAKWHPDETVIVFSHGGVGRMMHAICEEWPRDGRLSDIRFLDNGGIGKWTI